jgi:2-methylcitrate dehydratase PrpD
MTASLTERLVSLLHKPVADNDTDIAAVHLLDWVATAAAAWDRPEGKALTSMARRCPTGPIWTPRVGGRDAATAALVTGGLALVLEMDATHRQATLHPGPPVIAAAFAVAQQEHCTPRRLLESIVIGYEAMVRLGLALGAGHYRLWHTTSTAGPFGAAAAVAHLLECDDEQFADALGLAGSRTGGVWQTRTERAMAKPWHAGAAAQAGLYANWLALEGLRGPRRVLEGDMGLFAATSPDPRPELVVSDHQQEHWKIRETSLKPWAACRHVHPAIDAALIVRERAGDAKISRVEVETYPEALAFADNPDPCGAQAAMFSLQHCVALALHRGEVVLADFTDSARLHHCCVTELRKRVQVAESEPFTSAYPDHWGAQVSVVTEDSTVSAHVSDTRGDPERPMAVDDVRAKADELLAAAGVHVERRKTLADAALSTRSAECIEVLTALLP